MKKRVICVRTCIVREGSVLYGSKDGKRTITSPEEAAGFAASFFKDSDKEMIYVCTLNGHDEPVAMEMVAKGGVNYCHVDMAQIYKTEVTDLLLSATKAGDRQKGILRNAISWALKNRQYFESDFEAIEAGLEEIGTEKALGVRDKIWPLLKCNVFRESKKEIQKGKLNIISLEGLDPDLKVVISEILLKNLWKEALIVKENNITIVIDEFQHLLLNKKAMLVQLLTEGRKYGLDVILATQSLARFTNDTLVALNQAAVRLYFRPALNETKKLALQIDSVNVERTMLMLKQLKIGESVAVGNLEFSGRHMTRPIVVKTNYKEKLAPSIRRL